MYTIRFLSLFFVLSFTAIPAAAATLEENIQTSIAGDLQTPFVSTPLFDRLCTNGKPAKEASSVVEYWADFECPYCLPFIPVASLGVDCVVIRHMPVSTSSTEKSLAYEALLGYSPEAASQFWQLVAPNPATKEAALNSEQTRVVIKTALEQHKMAEVDFAKRIQVATSTVHADRTAGMTSIQSTPTWVVDGVRLSACDFNSVELKQAMALVAKAKTGDQQATNELIQLVIKENTEE